MTKITVFGTGYVGLVTGACLAENGHDVVCVDIDELKIENLKKGIMPIYEPGLNDLVKSNYEDGRLNFTTNAVEGVNHGKAIFSAVGTPPDENHRADLRFVRQIAETVGKYMTDDKVFINKSTVPVGTGDICREIIKKELEKRGEQFLQFDIVSNPEFLKEGVAISDFMVPDRIVCGVDSENAKKQMEEIYSPFVKGKTTMLFTDIKSSEIIKYGANAFLATKITFANMLSRLADATGADIGAITKGIGLDERIGAKFLHAGIGYGGSCFPKDVEALIETMNDYGLDNDILKSVEKLNEFQKTIIIEKLLKYLPNLSGKTISIWGLSFKPKTDDIRKAPSIEIINKLFYLGVNQIKVYDPEAMENMKQLYKGNEKILFYEKSYDVLDNSDALLLLTEWNEFRGVDFGKVREKMTGNVILDGRNIWKREIVESVGFRYEGIGR